MKRYSVRLEYLVEQHAVVEIEAENEEEALEKAEEIAPFQIVFGGMMFGIVVKK